MSRILVLGATGFIGRNIVKIFSDINKHKIIPHGRHNDVGIINSAYNSYKFTALLQKIDIIINCTGVGLSKLYRTNQTNNMLTKEICSTIAIANKNVKIFHLSTIKAYNPKKYIDPYAIDKAKAEMVFQDFDLLNRVCILRLPIVTGFNDPNLTPFINLSRKFRLPIVKTLLPKLNIISVFSFAQILHNLIDSCEEHIGQVVYVINNNNITWNELVQNICQTSFTLSFNSIRLLWWILSIKNHFSKKRIPFPKECFNDLFVYEWQIEQSCKVVTLNDDIINLLRSIKDDQIV